MSGSIPSSLEGDADCPPSVQDVQPVGGTSGQRTAKQCLGARSCSDGVCLWLGG